ncbi:hypothetical protein SM033_00182 [Vibrio phage vB_VpaM_sm033]|nr:hypothetical protein SM033_00182 [Vibrio phage vB_VpaM_sm033]
MAYKSVRDVFDAYTKLNVDKNFLTKLQFYVYGFINKNDVHTAHFGGNLVGVRPVRYIPADARAWLEDVMNIEEIRECQQELVNLPDINKDFRVSSDIVNLSFVYLLYRINQAKLDQRIKDEALVMTLVMNIAKHMCSLLSHRFKFPSDEIIAQQLYESLDNKSLLKRHGNWLNMIRAISLTMLDPKEGIHTRRRVWQDMKDDKQVVYMVNDIQDRLAGQINLLTEKYHDIKNNSDRLVLNSALTNIEGEKVLAEYVNRERALVKEMLVMARDPRNFIRPEIIDITVDVISTAEETHLRKVLEYMTDNVGSQEYIQESIRKVVVFVISEARQGRLDLNNAPEIISRLRNIFRANRIKKKDALDLKEHYTELVEESIPTARESIKTACRIAAMIYVAIRMLTLNAYR